MSIIGPSRDDAGPAARSRAGTQAWRGWAGSDGEAGREAVCPVRRAAKG